MTDPTLEETLILWLKAFAGSHFDELVDDDYTIIADDTLEALGYVIGDTDPEDEALHAVGELMFWARELTIVVGLKDDYERARQMYEDALSKAFRFLVFHGGVGGIRSIKLRGNHYHQADYYEDFIEPLNDWNPVI